MSNQAGNIANLIYAYISNKLTEEQEAELQQWLQASPGNEAYFLSVVEQIRSGELSSLYREADEQKIWQMISAQIPELQPAPVVEHSPNRFRKYAAVAAVITLVACTTLYFVFKPRTDHSTIAAKVQPTDVQPGTDKAVLTLADGQKVILDTTTNGQLMMQQSVSITKTADGKLEYHYTADNVQNETSMYNTISTPTGGRYRVMLPDGSQVWLNAQSSLRYPIAFDGTVRNVTLKGEGYFEIAPMYAKDSKTRVPFNVNVQSAEGLPVSTIEVKGTHFNIRAYDTVLRTTLTEGKVKVVSLSGATALLSPGQQAIQEGSTALSVNSIDTEESVAWVNGMFNFNNAGLKEIMEEVSRWYSLKVIYRGTDKGSHFSLNLSRDIPVSRLLEVMEMTGSVKFIIDKSSNSITVQQ
ncbi:DUF4974 domain-containing protein [Pseudoflavitalea sp. G-6-1-2]|uniref:FecR family protein n=1 Tax=Pseudoflavitalea sp. G-6-1-2 TaxID=2728841 RepID=UPI001469BC1E|nr:FecR family protein [Pseudoflavitalea sp. G-6-1-2]NML22973.1 DUF4974 domain-containing protein [Pseudoflavitalea sp. G-6-1-2]